MRNSMKYLKLICALLFVGVALAACSDDDKEGKVHFDRKSLFMAYGESVTMGFGGSTLPPGCLSPLWDGG